MMKDDGNLCTDTNQEERINSHTGYPVAIRLLGRKMAYVRVPMDLSKVKSKVAFNLTLRQIICFGLGAGIGIPFYLLTRKVIGNDNAMLGMVLLMIPAFLFAMYEKDGLPLEKVLMNIYEVKFKKPQIRLYETDNFHNWQMVRDDDEENPQIRRRNAEAAVHTASQRGGRKRARQG